MAHWYKIIKKERSFTHLPCTRPELPQGFVAWPLFLRLLSNQPKIWNRGVWTEGMLWLHVSLLRWQRRTKGRLEAPQTYLQSPAKARYLLIDTMWLLIFKIWQYCSTVKNGGQHPLSKEPDLQGKYQKLLSQALNRNLTQFESDILVYPRLCAVCLDGRQVNM